MGKSFNISFNFVFFVIRDDPSRSELIRPGLAVRVDPVQLLYLPAENAAVHIGKGARERHKKKERYQREFFTHAFSNSKYFRASKGLTKGQNWHLSEIHLKLEIVSHSKTEMGKVAHR